jgi:LPS-assembly lipoprotein
MWWRRQTIAQFGRLAAAFALASLAGGCFEPLYGARPTVDNETVRDKLTSVEIPPIPAARGQPAQRLSVALRNDLEFDLNGGAGANAPTHKLTVNIATTQLTIIIDSTSGRPDALIDSVVASYTLTEIATGKVVVTDSTFAHVDYDVPGGEQRFAKQRAQRDAEDRAVHVVAETIRNRLASYFVAGT